MLILKDYALRTQIFKTAGPAMVEMVMYMVIGLVDIAVVGRLGAAPLAAVGLGAEIFFSVILFLEALAIGSAILVAQAKGAGRMEDAGEVAGHTFLLSIVLGLLVAFLGISFAPDILNLFAVEKAVYDQALNYLLITFLISPLALGLYMAHSIFRGLGRTDIPMIIALAVNIVNVVGDFVLVFGLWGFPRMEVAGAALATSLAHVVGFILAALFLFNGKSGLRVNLRDVFKVNLSTYRKIFHLGIPSLAEQLFFTLANLVSLFLIAYLGTLAFASHQLAITVESVSYMPGFGIAVAVTALVGHAVGAQDKQALQKAARGSMEFALLFMGMFTLFFALLPNQIAAIFTNDPDVIALSAVLIRIAAIEQVGIALSSVISGILKGSGDTRTPMVISTLFFWCYRLPLMYLFIRIWGFQIAYVWLIFISDWLLRGLTFTVIYRRKKWLKRALPQNAG
ncbi:Multi antimicrobial extrusion protein [Syntrophomonas zehnderi OL-4]|uniref:Probable multidrug resistance protein NorM n=1 Tax=Syntrophomonas zehnderi OL-4 TaxID=690567 RepID=A0A0E3W383_9FIRM|nr:MATE family efflux transporter [Syntrophomonas zehnderi]CFX58680.1 Multi antimicrobial extrusion protein [Syntrophomonas zehnderi OL-4]